MQPVCGRQLLDTWCFEGRALPKQLQRQLRHYSGVQEPGLVQDEVKMLLC